MQFRRCAQPRRLMAAVLTLALAGCANGGTPETSSAEAPEPRESVSRAAKPKPSRPPASTAAETPSPTASATASESASAATRGGHARATLAQRLLPASRLPGFNAEFTWRESGTRREEGEPFGTCHRFPMTSIGAMRVVVREYAPGAGPDTDTASELVAQFPDGMTAKRALEVLKSWRGQCERELSGYDHRRVGDLQRVEVRGGDAGWYLLTYGPPEGGSQDEGYFDSQGLVRVGNLVAVVQMRLVGQDFNYPAGREPMVEAVRRAAVELG